MKQSFPDIMSQPWTCCKCGETFFPTWGNEAHPVAFTTKRINGLNVKDGEICRSCYK